MGSTAATSQVRKNYLDNVDTLRDIILNDHFGGDMAPEIVDQWLRALEPGRQFPLPPNIKGFYGGSLRESMPIEIARGSYKHIMHTTDDTAKVDKYAGRMLIALSILDLESLVADDPTLGALALWHKALAQVRLPDKAGELAQTLQQYQAVRPRSNLSDSKLPETPRLKIRLEEVARELGNTGALDRIADWDCSSAIKTKEKRPTYIIFGYKDREYSGRVEGRLVVALVERRSKAWILTWQPSTAKKKKGHMFTFASVF
ncbi:unnamed protein product [Clonostachys rhizophaga]|uniref:Uncharacterized protein n=1 Tax=Clonostachys rhizophaga TaxID=160324 RepID=A0A9N9VZ28_9HYPO|nr:unnamed protein product [Clonostachys rhizophaga]